MLLLRSQVFVTGENIPSATSFTILLCKCCRQRYPGPGLKLPEWHQGPYAASSPCRTVDFPVTKIRKRVVKFPPATWQGRHGYEQCANLRTCHTLQGLGAVRHRAIAQSSRPRGDASTKPLAGAKDEVLSHQSRSML